MLRRVRSWHKWVGLISAVFLMILAGTGFLLAIKGRVDWIRPATQKGTKMPSLVGSISLEVAAKSAVSVGIPELASVRDIDRFEYHTDKNIFKILSVKGYHEVQVDGATGKVLSVGKRNDQLIEDIHDFSFFSSFLHQWWLPVVALGLLALACSGLLIYTIPVLRRRKFERENPDLRKRPPDSS